MKKYRLTFKVRRRWSWLPPKKLVYEKRTTESEAKDWVDWLDEEGATDINLQVEDDVFGDWRDVAAITGGYFE